ncbi:nuclear transport factor 2 family protein [Solimonas terrae]|uniref:Nuclear transport factor 2 family protein n=1 Tax=Solimonas terrae TaxID=1396819 RepID=A0A6M2BMV3_9GAMM|nr:nuclear transport factor 2 family protein [Solimonas terrae]NGY03936.1 nuclear transport factor 2 family protein [Solimonas terrae]
MTETDRIATQLAIMQVKARYCRFLDTKNWTEYAALFTDDFELDVSEGSSLPVIRGRDAALTQIRASIGDARTAHQVHTPEIEFVGDNEARVIWAMQDRVLFGAEHAARVGLAGLTGYGHYHERYVRQNGVWKLAASRLTRLHLDLQPVAAKP